MSLLEKLSRKKDEMVKQMRRGREVTEQMRAEKLRRKQKKLADMKPSTKRTILLGLKNRSSPLDVMKEEYSRRKYEREKKYGKK